MKTQEFKQNKTLRVGAVLTIVALITLIGLTFTFAKYVSQGSGQDDARVAKWGVGIPIDKDLGLFDGAYGNPVDVSSKDGANVIAPGTSKNVLVTLISETKPEVMYDFNVDLQILDKTTEGKTGQESLVSLLDNYKPWNWTLNGVKYGTFAAFKDAVHKLSQLDVPPNTLPNNTSMNIGWIWDFDQDAAATYVKGTYDTSDTYLGNQAVTDALTHLQVVLKVDAVQCQGGHTPPSTSTLYGVTSTTDSNKVVSDAEVDFVLTNGDVAASTKSDSTGHYSFQVENGLTGYIRITHDDYQTTGTNEFTVSGDQEFSFTALVEKLDPQFNIDSADISVKVGEESTRPVTSASEGWYDASSDNEAVATAEITYINDNGIPNFVVKGVGEGTTTVHASQRATGKYKAADVTINVHVTAQPTPSFRTVSGTVVDTTSNGPVSGATVEFANQTQTTIEDGKFSFSVAEGTRSKLTVTMPQRCTTTYSYDIVVGGEDIDLQDVRLDNHDYNLCGGFCNWDFNFAKNFQYFIDKGEYFVSFKNETSEKEFKFCPFHKWEGALGGSIQYDSENKGQGKLEGDQNLEFPYGEGSYDIYVKDINGNLWIGVNMEPTGEHKHDLETVQGKEATYQESGYSSCYKCMICGKYFEDDKGETEIGDQAAYDEWKEADGRIDILKTEIRFNSQQGRGGQTKPIEETHGEPIQREYVDIPEPIVPTKIFVGYFDEDTNTKYFDEHGDVCKDDEGKVITLNNSRNISPMILVAHYDNPVAGGKVYDATNNNPISEINITLTDSNGVHHVGKSDENGNYTLNGLVSSGKATIYSYQSETYPSLSTDIYINNPYYNFNVPLVANTAQPQMFYFRTVSNIYACDPHNLTLSVKYKNSDTICTFNLFNNIQESEKRTGLFQGRGAELDMDSLKIKDGDYVLVNDNDYWVQWDKHDNECRIFLTYKPQVSDSLFKFIEDAVSAIFSGE